MADKDKYAKEKLTEEELNEVNGGLYAESFNVARYMYQAGFDNVLNSSGIVDFPGLRSALNSIGISVEDHGGLAALGGTKNVYTNNATGEKMNQAGMMSFLRAKYPNVRYKEIVEPQSVGEILSMIK